MTIERSSAHCLQRSAVKSCGLTRSVDQPRAPASAASVCAIGEPPTITRCGTGSTGSM